MRPDFNRQFWFIVDLIIGVLFVVFWVGVLGWLVGKSGLFSPTSYPPIKQFFGVGIVLVVSAIAFGVRLWSQWLFGIAEAAFATAVAWRTIGASGELNGVETIFGLTAAIYLVVRGLDNWYHGLAKRSEKRNAA